MRNFGPEARLGLELVGWVSMAWGIQIRDEGFLDYNLPCWSRHFADHKFHALIPDMKQFAQFIALILLFGGLSAFCQSQQKTPQKETTPTKNVYSGMYSFLQDGEFVQLTIEDDGSVTGFISRYGDQESDKDTFLNQFFKTAKLDGNKLEFTTKTVHSIWYEFSGTTETENSKKPDDVGARVLRGTLKEYSTGENKQQTVNARQVVFKSFPQDVNNLNQ